MQKSACLGLASRAEVRSARTTYCKMQSRTLGLLSALGFPGQRCRRSRRFDAQLRQDTGTLTIFDNLAPTEMQTVSVSGKGKPVKAD